MHPESEPARPWPEASVASPSLLMASELLASLAVLGERGTERVVAVRGGDEIQVRDVARRDRGLQAGFAGRCNGARRQARVPVRVVRRDYFEILVIHSLHVAAQGVLHSGIGL